MKKFIKNIFALALGSMFILGTFTACGNVDWSKNVTLKTPGNVIDNAGFVLETDNYYYFINGEQDNTQNNDYGTPVKGSLMVADKNDLTKSEIVVPKIISSTDLNTSAYIFGDSVYFATPSTQKNTSGDTVSNYIDFCSAKLDGSSIETYLSIDASSIEYRIVSSAEGVLFIYIDSADNNIYSYSVATKQKTLIAEDFTEVKFVDNSFSNVVLFFTKQIEKQYNTEKYDYNIVYAYSVSGGTKEFLNGEKPLGYFTYNILAGQNGYVYYSSTDGTVTEYYSITEEQLVTNAFDSALKLNSSAGNYLSATVLAVSPSEVYTVETVDENTFVVKDNMTTTIANFEKEIVATGTPSTIIKVDTDYVYYTNADAKVIRYNRAENREETVTEDSIISSWYNVEFKGNKMFYVNGSTIGCNYVNYIDVTTTLSEREKEDKTTEYYIDKATQQFIGLMTESDKTLIVENLAKALSDNEKIVFDTDGDGNVILVNGEPTCEFVDEVNVRYNQLTEDQKEEISDEAKTNIDNYNESLRISKMLYKLFGFDDVTQDKNTFKPYYEQVKPIVDDLRVKAANEDVNATVILARLVENGRWYLQECEKYFAE